MTYEILPLTAAHISQAAEIERLCFSDPWSEKMLAEHLANPCSLTLAAVGDTGRLLGYVGLLAVVDEGYITNVAVRPDCRRQGVAAALLDALEAQGKERELAFLTLEVRQSNAPARALYEKLGYLQAGLRRNYYENPREDAIIMTKTL